MKLSNILATITVLLICGSLQAQDTLAHYSLAQLDSIYQKKDRENKRADFLPYTLAMLKKANKELDRQDTAYAKVLFKVGRGYYFKNNRDSAFVFYQRAIDIQKNKIPHHPDYAWSLNNLGLYYSAKKDYAKAEPLYLQSLQIRKEALGEKHLDYAASLSNLGDLYLYTKNYIKAELFYFKALEIYTETFVGKHRFQMQIFSSLGGLYRELGDYTKAESFCQKALQFYKETVGEKLSYGVSLSRLAGIYQEMGNYNQAEAFYLQTLNIYKEIYGKKHYSYAGNLNALGNLYALMGDYAKAEPLYLQVLQIQKEITGEKSPEYALVLNNTGALYYKMNDLTKAETYYLEALEIRKKTIGEKHLDYAGSLNNVGGLYQSMGNYTQAESLLLQALQIRKELVGNKHPRYCATIDNIAMLYQDMGEYPKAETFFAELLSLRLDYLENTGKILSEKAKQEFFKTIAPDINHVNKFAAEHRQHDSILVYIQNNLLFTKGYALAGVSELLPLIKSLNDSTLTATYAAWTYTKTQLGKAYEMKEAERAEKSTIIDSLQQLVREQEATLMQVSAILKERLGYDKKRFYYKDLVKTVTKEDITIDFVRFENGTKDTAWYYALITQQGWAFPKYIPLCTEKQLEFYASANIHPEQESYITKNSDNKALYDLIIRPLEPYLKKKKRMHWAPVGLMNQVAMGTLKDDKGKMLGERFEIHQYGSLKDFIIKKQGIGSTGSIDKSVLLVGDIAFDLDEKEHLNLVENSQNENLYASRSISSDSTRGSSRFVPLKGTKVEIESLNKAFTSNKWTIKQLQQKDALEEKVREYTGDKTPSVLHFATHGFFISAKKQGHDNPLLRSGIALAGANRVWMGKPQLEGVEDGLWTAYEIANANLMQADLVVLSACETARGQIDPHEGVVGLQRSFKIAGVENMLLSLWQVPDKETVELMEEFYKYYLKGAVPSEALRKAQATMRKKYPEPYYWAAFILIE